MKPKSNLANRHSTKPTTFTIRSFLCAALLALVATSPRIGQADDVEYAITAANELGTVNFQTGAFTLLGTAPISSGSNLGNITRMPGGLIYGCDARGRLLLIDPITLTTSYVGTLASGSVALGNINDVVFRPDGTMFNIPYKDDHLYTVDPNTAAATLVATVTGDSFTATQNYYDLKFDNASRAYLLNHNVLYRLNTSTGQLTLLGPIGFSVYALGVEGAEVYGFTTDGRILRLDLTTGAGTVVATESCASPIVAVCSGGIVVGAPSLSIQPTNFNSFCLSWAAPSNQFRLQENRNLGTTNWTTVTNAVSITNSLHQVIVSPLVPMDFFRLIHP
jgi:hypothetical protein